MIGKKKKSRGRPKGSPVEPALTVAHYPTRCPTCGSEKLKVINGTKQREMIYGGKLQDGRFFNRITWDHKRCECGQRVDVQNWHLVDSL